MKRKRYTLGKGLVASMSSFIEDVRDGKPLRQTVARRMKVKVKYVWVMEHFTAPVGTKGRL
jgi:hypothetical protein